MGEIEITAAKYLADNGQNIAIEFISDGKVMHVGVGAVATVIMTKLCDRSRPVN